MNDKLSTSVDDYDYDDDVVHGPPASLATLVNLTWDPLVFC